MPFRPGDGQRPVYAPSPALASCGCWAVTTETEYEQTRTPRLWPVAWLTRSEIIITKRVGDEGHGETQLSRPGVRAPDGPRDGGPAARPPQHRQAMSADGRSPGVENRAQTRAGVSPGRRRTAAHPGAGARQAAVSHPSPLTSDFRSRSQHPSHDLLAGQAGLAGSRAKLNFPIGQKKQVHRDKQHCRD